MLSVIIEIPSRDGASKSSPPICSDVRRIGEPSWKLMYLGKASLNVDGKGALILEMFLAPCEPDDCSDCWAERSTRKINRKMGIKEDKRRRAWKVCNLRPPEFSLSPLAFNWQRKHRLSKKILFNLKNFIDPLKVFSREVVDFYGTSINAA